LHEIEHIESAAELQAHDVARRIRHSKTTRRGGATRRKWITHPH
jgi:hypothetical protein